jgi:hypothetical protein
MNPQDKPFFELLRAGLWETPVESKFTKQMLGRTIRTALSQAVLGLVADAIVSDEELSGLLSEEDIKPLRRFVLSNLSTSRTWNITLQRIVSELREQGIEPYILKGQGIAQFYSNPDLRQCGDIDLYVSSHADYEKACEIIDAMGTDEDHKNDKSIEKHYHTRVGKVPVEIHRYTDVYYQNRLNKIYQAISDEGFRAEPVQVDIAGFKITTPPVDFNVFYIFNHLWHHFIADGVGLRQICDWVMLLHKCHAQINLDHLQEMLEKMELMKQWKVFGYIAVDVLGLPEEEFPFYDRSHVKLSEKVYKLVMLEGNFGQENLKNDERPSGYLSGKVHSLTFRFKRNFRVLTLFPKDSLRHMHRVAAIGIKAVLKDAFCNQKK